MLLSARILNNVASANVFEHSDVAEFTEGDGPTIFFQLVDLSLDRSEQGFNPSGRRYMPALGATLEATIDHIDNAKRITRYAIQPFPLDPSIWAVSLMPTDKVRGTADLRLTLTEGSRVTRGIAKAAISAHPQISAY